MNSDPAKERDVWLEGFEEGRRATARSVAARLRGTMSDEDLAALVGFDLDSLGEGADSGDGPRAGRAAVRGLRLVEPSFVRAVRAARRLTQPQLARILGVNVRTVCEWETSELPVRMKSASYDRLAQIAAGRPGSAAGR